MGSHRAHVWYSGRVQGVGFRWRTHEIILPSGLTGFVRNLPDGQVELVLDGSQDEIRAMLDRLELDLESFIHGRRIEWTEAKPRHSSFVIRR